MVRPATCGRRPSSRSAIARPLVSVASVRVSLTVSDEAARPTPARAPCARPGSFGAIVARAHATIRACRVPCARPAPDASSSSCCRRARVFAACVDCVGERRRAIRSPLDRAGERWVEQTLKKLTLDEKIGQLIVPSFESNFLSTDSDTFDTLARLVRDYHVGGFHVFGASQPAPSVLLNPGYGTVILGQPFAAAFLINRLQAMSTVPLLNTADFETGVGFRIFGATAFPRQMAMGAIPRRRRCAAGARGGADHRASKRARSACR